MRREKMGVGGLGACCCPLLAVQHGHQTKGACWVGLQHLLGGQYQSPPPPPFPEPVVKALRVGKRHGVAPCK